MGPNRLYNLLGLLHNEELRCLLIRSCKSFYATIEVKAVEGNWLRLDGRVYLEG